MSAVLLVSPSPARLLIGQAQQLRCQVRDSEVRMPYDLTGAGTITAKIVSLTGGTARPVAGAITQESLPNGTFSLLINGADSTALAAGRWYLQVSIPTVTAQGGGTLIPDLYPLDVVQAL